jgi:hypothetical protein
MDKQKAITLSGMFALSNMGLPLPDKTIVARAKKYPPKTADDSAYMFCEHVMETNEHERAFKLEARDWKFRLSNMTDEQAAKTWPDMIALYDAA